MPAISTGNFGKLLWPGVNTIYGAEYKKYGMEYKQIFTTSPSTKKFEEDVGVTSFGLTPVKAEGSGVSYDTQKQAFVTRYTHVTYGLGFIVTREMYDDNQYEQPVLNRASALAFSVYTTRETVAANILNRGFNDSYVYGDGVELFSSAHPNASGGTWRNELTTSADLSEASLEQACIDISKLTNDRGLTIAVKPMKLHIPADLDFEAGRILKSQLQSGGANNDINVLRATGKFPGGVHVNHYFTDTKAWFIGTDCPTGMRHFERWTDRFSQDNDFDTDNAKFKTVARYSFGATDPRAMFASEGS